MIDDKIKDFFRIDEIAKALSDKLSRLCITSSMVMTLNKDCIFYLIYHPYYIDGRFCYNNYILTGVSGLISDRVLFFLNSYSYDYVKIIEEYYPELLEISDRIKLNKDITNEEIMGIN